MKTEASLWDEIKAETAAEITPQSILDDSQNPVDCWLITSETLGQGDEDFGKELLTDFLTVLLTEENPPCYLLFCNSAVKLLAESSPLLPLVYEAEKRGTSVLVSKKSADFYGIAVDLLFQAETAAMVKVLKSAAKTVTL